jgi:NNP family nitrate/nitrite transporter-like MFS transporter
MMDPTASRARLSTLVACFLHFDFSFMVWILIGALGIPLADAAHLSPGQKGVVVAVPLLAGSLLRIPVGLCADYFGGRRVGIALLAFLFVPLALAWQIAPSLPSLIAIGAMLGAAGASFSVALPLASRWFPPERQGLVLGIAAAGNSGTVVTNLVAPRLAASIGVASTFLVAMGALALVLAAFAALAHEPPRRAARATFRFPSLSDPDLRWLCLFYMITFGGYVGLSSFLPLYLRDGYDLAPIDAGYITAGLAFLGSASRPIGGFVADRVGGARLLAMLMVPISVAYAIEASEPALPMMIATLAVSMLCLGLGNGAVFQIVPQRFGRDIGAVTGVVGALGGIGGFFLPTLLGNMREYAGTFGYGFAALAIVAAVAAGCLLLGSPRRRWVTG